MSRKALIAVDIQNDYFPGGKWTLSGMDQAADNAARLLAAARAKGDLVVHVRHEFPTTEAPFFCPGSEGAQIHKKVLNQADEPVVVKQQINSFRDTKLKEILDAANIKDVTICGAMSHMCIDAVTRAAHDFGYNVTLVHDACATRDLDFNDQVIPAAQVHAAYMSALGFAYAKVVSTADYLAAVPV
ncbi:MAG: cysteine hydrolase [Cyanobacteria bacterium SZAS TMP-1]|nr:cysteine hydrolase [Cyanobacteria bacterium SZAS TMP-1]